MQRGFDRTIANKKVFTLTISNFLQKYKIWGGELVLEWSLIDPINISHGVELYHQYNISEYNKVFDELEFKMIFF